MERVQRCRITLFGEDSFPEASRLAASSFIVTRARQPATRDCSSHVPLYFRVFPLVMFATQLRSDRPVIFTRVFLGPRV